MNLKRIFGAILTILGIAGLIYTAMLFANSGDGGYKSLIIYGVLGFVFFCRDKFSKNYKRRGVNFLIF